MTRTMRITADASKVSMAASIRATAKAAPLLCLTVRALGELADELGGYSTAAAFLLEIAESNNRPIAVNIETGPDTSSTAFLAPRTWTEERLAGWTAGRHQELEDEFGRITRVSTMPGEPG